MTAERTTYHLVPPASPPRRPVDLDADQQRVVDHEGGPLLVLAGPGTGKTTTLVEAIAERIERRGVDPDAVLGPDLLPQGRRAAPRPGGRAGRPHHVGHHLLDVPLLRLRPDPAVHARAELYDEPLRLLSAPEQDVVLQQILTRAAESVVWPEAIAGRVGTRGFAAEVAQVLARAQEKGLGWESLRELGLRERLPEYVAAAAFMEQYDWSPAARTSSTTPA